VGEGGLDVALFDRAAYNATVSIQDNILFGRLRYGRPRSAPKIGALIREVIDKLEVRRGIMEVGLDFAVGVSGSRLTPSQRQKLAIARAVLKRPDILILDQATSMLDGQSQTRILDRLREELRERTLIWLIHRASLAREFDEILVMERGKVVQQGRFEDLNREGSVLSQLVAAG
jgi:ABC-type multidrug transport system fused ATPase/permease subunit